MLSLIERYLYKHLHLRDCAPVNFTLSPVARPFDNAIVTRFCKMLSVQLESGMIVADYLRENGGVWNTSEAASGRRTAG